MRKTSRRSMDPRLHERHGMYGTGAYRSWIAMVQRCYDTNNRANVKNYKERGITVCDEWRNSFIAFHKDMGDRPSPRHSLDRIDNSGPYAPWNCRWVTPMEQAANRSATRKIEFGAVVDSVSGWSRRLGVTRDEVYRRIRKGEMHG